MVDIPTTSKSAVALPVATGRVLAFANSAGVSETELWPSTRSEDFYPEMAKSLLNQGETIPDVWHHWYRRASGQSGR